MKQASNVYFSNHSAIKISSLKHVRKAGACVHASFFIRFGSIIVSVQHDVITSGRVRRSLSSAVA